MALFQRYGFRGLRSAQDNDARVSTTPNAQALSDSTFRPTDGDETSAGQGLPTHQGDFEAHVASGEHCASGGHPGAAICPPAAASHLVTDSLDAVASTSNSPSKPPTHTSRLESTSRPTDGDQSSMAHDNLPTGPKATAPDDSTYRPTDGDDTGALPQALQPQVDATQRTIVQDAAPAPAHFDPTLRPTDGDGTSATKGSSSQANAIVDNPLTEQQQAQSLADTPQDGDRILILHERWLRLILSGEKTMETGHAP